MKNLVIHFKSGRVYRYEKPFEFFYEADIDCWCVHTGDGVCERYKNSCIAEGGISYE